MRYTPSNIPMKDGINLLIDDHRTQQSLFQQFRSASPVDHQSRVRLMQEITRELSIHSVIEEQVLYPLMRVKIGDELADHGLQEHREMKVQLDKLEHMSDLDEHEKYEKLAQEMIHGVEHHIKDEEEDMFPELRTKLDEKELHEMHEQLSNAKLVAPIHPHPELPDKPPQNIISSKIGMWEQAVEDSRDDVKKQSYA